MGLFSEESANHCRLHKHHVKCSQWQSYMLIHVYSESTSLD